MFWVIDCYYLFNIVVVLDDDGDADDIVIIKIAFDVAGCSFGLVDFISLVV